MKTAKTMISVCLVLSMLLLACFSITSCGDKKSGYTVGICQLIQHPALDAATKGFKDALIQALGAENVTFDEQNAQGDSGTCVTIVNSFVSKKVDLIMANATPALQSAANATLTIPILGTSVTDYADALGLTDFDGVVGGNISGTSDLAPLDQQAQMILDLVPGVSTVGLLYCSAESNSVFQVSRVRAYLKSKGVICTDFTFTDSNDIAAVTTAACAACDALYVPTDNVAANCSESIGAIVKEKKTPLIAGEEGICKSCGVATLSIDYYDLGYKTGEMAAKILKGEDEISAMPIAYADATTKKYNAEICALLGIIPPAGYEPIAD